MSPTSYQTALPRDMLAKEPFSERSRLTSIAGYLPIVEFSFNEFLNGC